MTEAVCQSCGDPLLYGESVLCCDCRLRMFQCDACGRWYEPPQGPDGFCPRCAAGRGGEDLPGAVPGVTEPKPKPTGAT